MTVAADVGDAAAVQRMVEEVTTAFGSLDILVNNAGMQTWTPFLDVTETEWDLVIRTNLKGCFLCTQAAARAMSATSRGGVVVNIGSGCNKVPFPNLVDYSTSKGGIEQFTKVAAIELGKYGIRVNCVAPGAIEIERTRREAPEYAATWAAVTPLGRVGQGSDVANAVLFFAESGSTFVTGQTLWVDGGAFTVPNWPYGKSD
jgi:3-oxoacyl-[acyl-carrier protein] reductase